jgi:hypothetical protein
VKCSTRVDAERAESRVFVVTAYVFDNECVSTNSPLLLDAQGHRRLDLTRFSLFEVFNPGQLATIDWGTSVKKEWIRKCSFVVVPYIKNERRSGKAKRSVCGISIN